MTTTTAGLRVRVVAPEPSPPARSATGGVFLVIGLLLVAFGISSFLGGGGLHVLARTEPYDLDINLVAAQRLLDRQPLYDRDASRADAVALAGGALDDSYTWALNSYPSPPSTALFHVPFLAFDHSVGVTVFRWMTLLGMVAAVVIAAHSLPRASRVPAMAVGLGALATSLATAETLSFGQGHEFVMLGLATGVWGTSRKRWKLAGVGFGVATVLKLSPGLILLYLLLRGRREAAASGVATTVGFAATAAVLGRPQDLWTWATDVVPAVSHATRGFMNQSLPALFERITSPSTNVTPAPALGAWRYLAATVALGAVLGLWRMRRRHPVGPLELGVLVLACLLAGPLTWTHYATWAVIPIVLFADPRHWETTGRSRRGLVLLIAGALVLLSFSVSTPSAAVVRTDFVMQFATSPYTAAFVLLIVVGIVLLRDSAAVAPAQTDTGAVLNPVSEHVRIATTARPGPGADVPPTTQGVSLPVSLAISMTVSSRLPPARGPARSPRRPG